jgi:hypothetical protein
MGPYKSALRYKSIWNLYSTFFSKTKSSCAKSYGIGARFTFTPLFLVISTGRRLPPPNRTGPHQPRSLPQFRPPRRLRLPLPSSLLAPIYPPVPFALRPRRDFSSLAVPARAASPTRPYPAFRSPPIPFESHRRPPGSGADRIGVARWAVTVKRPRRRCRRRNWSRRRTTIAT